MLTLGSLRQAPERAAELHGCDVLIAAAAAQEVLPPKSTESGPQTAVFQHETIAMLRAERAAQLEHLHNVVDAESAVIALERRPTSFWGHVTLGRIPTADLVLPDPAVSTYHAEFVLGESGGVAVMDVGSSNGTFVNREPLHPHRPRTLKTGDCVRFGQTVFYFVAADRLAALVA